jgi:hypothetical protein
MGFWDGLKSGLGKLWHNMHWICMGSMLLMSAAFVPAIVGLGNTTFGAIAINFGQHLIAGFTNIASAMGGLLAAAGNSLGFVGAEGLSQSFMNAAQGLASTAPASGAEHLLHQHAGHIMTPAAAPVAFTGAEAVSGPAVSGASAQVSFAQAAADLPQVSRDMFNSFSAAKQGDIVARAAQAGMTLRDYMQGLCLTPSPG